MQESQHEEFSLKSIFVPLTTTKAIHLIVILGFIVFGNMLLNGFVWDDLSILQNPDIISGFNLPNLFGGNIFNSLHFYRPLSAVYFSLIYNIFGPNNFIFHLIQLSLHIGNCILLYLLLKKFFKNALALLLVLIFLVHPINVESVVFVSSTVTVLSVFFGLSALLLVTQDKISQKQYILIAVLLLASPLTKELGFVFVVMICLYALLFAKDKLRALVTVAVITTISYAFLHLLKTPVRYSTMFYIPMKDLSLQERILNIPAIIVYYLKTFVFPQHLAINQLWVVKNISLQNFFIPVFVILNTAVLLFIQSRRLQGQNKELMKLYFFFIFWFCISLSFYLQIIPLENTVADRWFYVPMIGALGVIGVIIHSFKHTGVAYKKLGVFLVILLIIIFSIRTMYRNTNWQNEVTLYTHDIQYENSYQMEDMVGTALFNANNNENKDQAIYHLKTFNRYVSKISSNTLQTWCYLCTER